MLGFYYTVVTSGMARPQAVDGEDGLQIWRVAANIFKKKENKEVGDS
jgi:hypothetical protein